MFVLLMAAIVATISAVPARSRRDLPVCMFKAKDDKTIDFNVLATKGDAPTGDYTVASVEYPRFEYIFNVCDKLNFADDKCPAGSAVCDRQVNTGSGESVWASTKNITLTYQPYHNRTGDVPTMEFDSEETCYHDQSKKTVVKIFFLCSEQATKPVLSLDFENLFKCEVDINFETAVACGGSTAKKYKCENNQCTPTEDGGIDYETCSKVCSNPPTTPAPTPPPVGSHYSCNPLVDPGICSENPAGEYSSKESCDAQCKYTPPSNYTCKDNTCIAASEGVPKASCESVCGGGQTKKYKCEDDTCKEDPSGTYPTQTACEDECNAKYKCDGTCVKSPDGGPLSVCKQVCGTGREEPIFGIF